jgi:U-box domain/von Willebrand factor type A domain
MTDSSASFFCPITHELMVDPVIDSDGNSYEKHAIEDWIRRSGTSPITRTALSIDDLHPNRALKTAIDEYRLSVQPDIQSNPVPMKVQSSEITVSGSYANGFVHISIQPPQEESRSPCDICCVVDTSGSMSNRAEIQNDKNEQYGLSQLDLVKHALKTIIQSLQIQDRLSIVSFSDNATILFQLTSMNDEGKTNALAAVEELSVSRSFKNI